MANVYKSKYSPYLKTIKNDVFPVNRIFCVGLNYTNNENDNTVCECLDMPLFMKPNDAIVHNGSSIPYPAETKKFFFEIELVVAIINGGKNITKEDANSCIYGYSVGLDMTRYDLQERAMRKGYPWETSKSFESSAPCSRITPVSSIGLISNAEIILSVNNKIRQSSNISKMINNVSKIISYISKYNELKSGDLIYTGTPPGAGDLCVGDKIEARITGLETLNIQILYKL